MLVTFNGKSFDWPLLQTRYRMTRVGTAPEPLAYLDLLHPARRLWRLQLNSVAQAQLERHVLKLDRGQDIPSETIPQRYFDFLRGGSPDAVATAVMGYQDPMADKLPPFAFCENHLRIARDAGIGVGDLARIDVRGMSIAEARTPFAWL